MISKSDQSDQGELMDLEKIKSEIRKSDAKRIAAGQLRQEDLFFFPKDIVRNAEVTSRSEEY